ncbi:MAG: tRNA (adenosine(37)-N6)-threonylcarbamoyltransferase complex ATPase subunit type 1 TsaE [Aerococcus suis]|nr:tRNA (adenosine(37)-N6)-threonylcarbamoyltransferase complex ATPase subunit type 1 TsaE [Aerococcus suis]
MEQQVTWMDEQATERFAQQLAELVQPGDVICLQGDLGAGKTTFTQYFGKGLGIKRAVKSPTYTIIREYEQGRIPLYHMDAYRLEETGAEGIGLWEYFDGDGVCVIEWPQFIVEDLPDDYLWVTIKKLSSSSRQVSLVSHGARSQAIIQCLED